MLGKLDNYMQKNETRPLFYTIHKNKFKCIKDLNVRPKTIKLLEKNIGNMLFDTDLINFFFNLSPQARTMKAKINKWDYINLIKLLQ